MREMVVDLRRLLRHGAETPTLSSVRLRGRAWVWIATAAALLVLVAALLAVATSRQRGAYPLDRSTSAGKSIG